MDRERWDIDDHDGGEFSNLVNYILSFLKNRGVYVNKGILYDLSQTLCVGLLDFDCPAINDIEQHRADFHTFVFERCGHVCGTVYYPALEHRTSDDEIKGNAHNYSQVAGRYCHGRKFFLTENGRFGIAPPGTQRGDVCAVILGSRVPFVLRANDHDTNPTYSLLGEAYMNGMMRGEAVTLWRDGVLNLSTVRLT